MVLFFLLEGRQEFLVFFMPKHRSICVVFAFPSICLVRRMYIHSFVFLSQRVKSMAFKLCQNSLMKTP